MGNKQGRLARSSSIAPNLGPAKRDILVQNLLEVADSTLISLAKEALDKGDKFFSVAILRKEDLQVIVTGKDASSTNPISTAELDAINAFYANKNHPMPRDCIFLCLHEPNPMALYSFALCGFDNFIYLFSKEDTVEMGGEESAVSIAEIFGKSSESETYNQSNAYWVSFKLGDIIAKCENKDTYTEKFNEVKAKVEGLVKKDPSPSEPKTPNKSS